MNLFQRKNKSYQKKYKYYFGTIVMIPVLIILLVNLISQDVVKEQIVTSGEKILSQFFGLLERRMEDVIEDAYEVAENPEVIRYAQLNAKDPMMYAYYPIYLQAGLRQYAPDGVKDMFVWYAYDDRIVPAKNPSLLIEPYYNMFHTEIEREEFYHVVRNSTIIPSFTRLDSEGTQYLCLTLRQNGTKVKEYDFSVNMIFEQEWFEVLFTEGVLGKDENFLMYDEEGKLLFSHKPEKRDYLPEEYRRRGTYELNEEGEKYLILVQESKAIKGCYVLKISKDIFWQKLKFIQIISFIGVLCSVFVGLFVAFRFSNKAYKPLKSILKLAENDQSVGAFDAAHHDEVEYIETLLNKGRAEKEFFQNRMKAVEAEQKKKEFLLSILEDGALEETQREKFEKNGIYFDKENFLIGVLAVEDCGKIGWDMVSFVVTNVFEELGNERGQCLVMSLSGTRHVVVVNLEEELSGKEMKTLFERGMHCLQEYFKADVTLGLGRMAQELLGIHDAYSEAQMALEYRFLLGRGWMIIYDDIEGRKFNYPYSVENRMYQMVSGFLKAGRQTPKEVEHFISRLLEEYGIDEKAALKTVECFRYDVLQALNRLLMESQINYHSSQSYMSALQAADVLKEYCRVLQEIFIELNTDFLSANSRRNISRQIKEYVETHYMESALNVTYIGDVFDMQSAYLSKIFKEEYEITLPDFIAKVRINKSKVLLWDERLTIGEIAVRTGFLSSNIYINNFKKLEGITPGKYRELKEENRGSIDISD